jgi:cytochrome c oxidase assembly protein subunit 15
MNKDYFYARSVRWWLITGCILVFFQVVIGGITRLTNSGLSITEWNVIKGVIPPLNHTQWDAAFANYKLHAKTQFEAIHADMTLPQFKFIYFWEYFHRLWARSMGFIFLFPFLYFVYKRMLDKRLMRLLGIVVALAAFEGFIGWIMVASGLNTPERAWVSAYKLTLHLGTAVLLLGVLLRATYEAWTPQQHLQLLPTAHRLAQYLLVLLFIQILLGGLMSGMKAGLVYPTFPRMGNQWIPSLLFDTQQWTLENFLYYHRSPLAPTLVQLLHRTIAYTVVLLSLVLLINSNQATTNEHLRTGYRIFACLLVVQFLLGVFTLLYSIGSIPVVLGILHQAGGLLLFAAAVYIWHHTNSQLAARPSDPSL